MVGGGEVTHCQALVCQGELLDHFVPGGFKQTLWMINSMLTLLGKTVRVSLNLKLLNLSREIYKLHQFLKFKNTSKTFNFLVGCKGIDLQSINIH